MSLSSSLSSLSKVSRNSRRSGSVAGLGVGFSDDTRSLLLPQARLVFSSSFTHTELFKSCWSSSGEAKSGFPANFFSRNRACLFLERANAEGDLFFFRRRLYTGFTVVRPVTVLSSLALLGVLAGSLQLTVNENLSWLRVSFHENRLSSSFSSLFRTSTIDFGITLGNPSIINIQKSRWREIHVHSIRHVSWTSRTKPTRAALPRNLLFSKRTFIDAHPYKILETCQPCCVVRIWSRNQNEFINASSNGSDEPAQKHGLARAFSVRTHSFHARMNQT